MPKNISVMNFKNIDRKSLTQFLDPQP